jgi:D-alanyl-D-alanine carboxypeptidase (penicillin-binding protein 5/6)
MNIDTYWKNILRRSVFVCITLAVIAGVIFSYYAKAAPSNTAPVIQIIATSTKANPFDAIILQAKSAYVYDLKTGKILYQKDADTVRPLASLTKLMTALVASQTLSPTTTISISKQALAEEGDTGLRLGERWYFKDLLNFTLFVSSNDGAAAISESDEPFIDKMNQTAHGLGLNSLSFQNPTGLDVSASSSGGYGSAGDTGGLLAYILTHYPNMIELTPYRTHQFISLSGITHNVSNTDTVLNQIPGIIASKTGYTDLAGGNLAVAFDEDIQHPVIMVVLGSTYNDRFTDIVTLASSTRAYLNQ